MSIPYFYKIQEISTGKYYVGCQHGKTSNPNNFWKTYFTSSKEVIKKVKQFGPSYYKILKIIPREDAKDFEFKYLKRVYTFLGRQKFKEIMINKAINRIAYFDKEITESFRQKQAEGAKGNTNVRGTKWWNDGKINKRSKISPGNGWVLGFKFDNTNQKLITSQKLKGKEKTIEHKLALSLSAKNRIPWVKGKIVAIDIYGNKKYFEPSSIPEGFIKVNEKRKIKFTVG